MTDLERRLAETLEHEAAAAPDATGLAGRARIRARRHRRTRLGLVGAAVVAVAVPTVLLATSGSEPDRRRPAPIAVDPTPSATPAVPEGWRVVRWGDLEVTVPDDWLDGRRSSWCANEGSAEQGRVEDPEQGGFDILCHDPEQSYGVTLGLDASAASLVYPSGHVWRYDTTPRSVDAVQMYVEDSWLGYWYDDERMVWVNAGDRETVELVLASVRRLP